MNFSELSLTEQYRYVTGDVHTNVEELLENADDKAGVLARLLAIIPGGSAANMEIRAALAEAAGIDADLNGDGKITKKDVEAFKENPVDLTGDEVADDKDLALLNALSTADIEIADEPEDVEDLPIISGDEGDEDDEEMEDEKTDVSDLPQIEDGEGDEED